MQVAKICMQIKREFDDFHKGKREMQAEERALRAEVSKLKGIIRVLKPDLDLDSLV